MQCVERIWYLFNIILRWLWHHQFLFPLYRYWISIQRCEFSRILTRTCPFLLRSTFHFTVVSGDLCQSIDSRFIRDKNYVLSFAGCQNNYQLSVPITVLHSTSQLSATIDAAITHSSPAETRHALPVIPADYNGTSITIHIQLAGLVSL